MVILGIGLSNPSKIPIQPVRLPGSGGNPNRHGDGSANGGPLVDDPRNLTKDESVSPPAFDDSPILDPNTVAKARRLFDNDPAATSYINAGNPRFKAFVDELDQKLLRVGTKANKGQGGPPSKGSRGVGDPPAGDKPGIGGSGGMLTPREKRMLRWVLIFETQNPSDYVKQLDGLGAILGIPTSPKQLQLVKDLKTRPVKLGSDEADDLDRIYWWDNDARSATAVLHYLGVHTPARKFVAFMPKELEARMAELELKYRGLPEDEIYETKFQVFRSANGYDVRVVHQTRN
jgi:hypothetical protein